MQMPGAAYQTWISRKAHSILPRSGGWMDQPLALMAQDQAIETTVNLHRKLRADDADWTKLSRNEVALTKWIGLDDA